MRSCRTIDVEQRRARLGDPPRARQARSTRWRRPRPSWSGCTASDPATVYLAARARVRGFAHDRSGGRPVRATLARAHARDAAHDVRRPGRPRRGDGRGLHEGARAAAAPAADRDARGPGRRARRRRVAAPRRARHDGGAARARRGHRGRAHRVRADARRRNSRSARARRGARRSASPPASCSCSRPTGAIVRGRPRGLLAVEPVPVGADRRMARGAAADARPRRGRRASCSVDGSARSDPAR